ncbi:hypothetical protein [Terriglobus roseus]|uniref:hypothetical protein n=1 Tax=Terriglobus roseus TaxID=392734 RepID=UPI001114CE27|nr:hypothetical protein [Terriglobus roseus]
MSEILPNTHSKGLEAGAIAKNRLKWPLMQQKCNKDFADVGKDKPGDRQAPHPELSKQKPLIFIVTAGSFLCASSILSVLEARPASARTIDSAMGIVKIAQQWSAALKSVRAGRMASVIGPALLQRVLHTQSVSGPSSVSKSPRWVRQLLRGLVDRRYLATEAIRGGSSKIAVRRCYQKSQPKYFGALISAVDSHHSPSLSP